MASRFYYLDKETHELKEGFPPVRHDHFGDAPMIIMDSIPAYYHPKAERWIDSRADLRDTDKALGTITTDKKLEPDDSWSKAQTEKRHKDMSECLHAAVAQVDAGTSCMTEETRQKCERQNEIVSKALNFDAFNVAGRKTNVKGKKFRRR